MHEILPQLESPLMLRELSKSQLQQLAGEIRQETSRGTKIFNEDTDPSATIGLRGHIRF